jgi:hypothetical protein
VRPGVVAAEHPGVQEREEAEEAGTSIPLQGFYIVPNVAGARVCAVSGAASVIADGSVWFGATAHCLLTADVGVNVQFGGHGSTNFSASTHVDRDGDGTVDNSDVWEPIDCKTITIP